jgi:hypothetical protein
VSDLVLVLLDDAVESDDVVLSDFFSLCLASFLSAPDSAEAAD